MAIKDKPKSVSYFFRIEFSTIQGKITSGFCMLGLITIVLVLITCYILKPALEKSQHIVHVLDTTDHQLLLLSANTDNIVSLFNNKVLSQEGLKEEDLSAAGKVLQAPLDSLEILSKVWQFQESKLNLKVAALKLQTLQLKLKNLKALSSEEQKLMLESDLLPLKKEIQKQLKGIHTNISVERNELQKFIDIRLENLFLILTTCIILSIVIGAAFASYVLVKVLMEIKMLKIKILEMSEGKLIDPIPASKNELNTIIKALNLLTDNLRNIQEFAQEVGNGNFNTNITVFEGKNDLGESLAGMRASLITVAQEEKQRNWVTTGLAQFSELLRTSNDDLDNYYQMIISELVKYLKVNQAAIYVLETSERDEEVLEMKASYAWGRIKFHEKVIAPGQGMVGQVYLEKLPVFLKNVPANYLQIQSGLGDGAPRYLAVVPLKMNNTVNGVLELASFQELVPHELEFLMKMAENISGAIHNVTNVQTTTKLLEEAQAMAHAMQAQEEMLRQNSEELIATQEQLNRDLQETQQKLSLLEQALNQAPFPHLLLTQAGKVCIANEKANHYFNANTQDKYINSLLDHQDLVNFIHTVQAGDACTFAHQHPEKGGVSFHLHTFSIAQDLYINFQIIPQTTVSID